MRRPLLLVALAGAGVAFAGSAWADVIVRLKSGTELYATHTWTENGLVKFDQRGGVVGFPESEVESVTEGNVRAPIVRARPRPVVNTAGSDTKAGESAGQPLDTAEQPSEPAAETVAATKTGDAGDAPPASHAAVDARVPEVKHEDLQTRNERLDELAVEVHRELSVARSRGDPPDVVQALEQKIAEINKQRYATKKAIGAIH